MADRRTRWHFWRTREPCYVNMSETPVEIEHSTRRASGFDSFYRSDIASQKALLRKKPWTDDPHYFKDVKISSVALIKMAIHARIGGDIEVMGVMTGKIIDATFVVMDSYRLPVEGTETRVNAMGEALEYMVNYLDSLKRVGRDENIVGWYHSHPGYGCWLSGIDVGTQRQNQQFQDPFLAIVIDPHRTAEGGKIDIGAFRTYNENVASTKSSAAGAHSTSNIPSSKKQDFGYHADQYYKLPITYFKSSADSDLLEKLWSQYWASTLADDPLTKNQELRTNEMEQIYSRQDMLEDVQRKQLQATITHSIHEQLFN